LPASSQLIRHFDYADLPTAKTGSTDVA